MLTMLGNPKRQGDGWSRREVLRAGAVSLPGSLLLPQLLGAEANSRWPRRKAKHVIVLYLLGGAATQDMFDLKPAAPVGVRSEFRPIPTSASGVQICEHLPRLARWMHRAAIIRSVTHKAGCHNPMPSYTGSEQTLPNIVTTSDSYPPSMGAVCEWLRQQNGGARRSTFLPDYVYMPCYLGWGQSIRRPGPYAGFLGQQYDALYTECTPAVDPGRACLPGQPQFVRGQPRLPDGNLGPGITLDRLRNRESLLRQFERQAPLAETRAARGGYERQQQRAFELLLAPAVKAAFDIDREPVAVREAYGRTLFGSSVLIARRLIEAGVRLVNATWDIFWERSRIDYDGWDTHTRNFPILKDWNLPQFDRAIAALMSDLDARGLLDETLIVVLSEMGRTPRVNGSGGRDHWTHCYSTLLAGGGIRGGTVLGASDAQAAYVKDRPVRPADICTTIYEALGIDPDLMVPDRAGRPTAISQGGEVLREILA